MSKILTGLDVLVNERFKRLSGLKVGLLAHPASVDSQLVHILNRCLEHGFWGNAQYMEGVEDTVDSKTGIPITSLYGHTRETLLLKPESLAGLDACS